MRRFNRNDLGCYADSSFGHLHVRQILGNVLRDAWSESQKPYGISQAQIEVLVDSLSHSMPDDAWDEEEALDILNTHFLQTNDIQFALVNGDLCLTTTEEN